MWVEQGLLCVRTWPPRQSPSPEINDCLLPNFSRIVKLMQQQPILCPSKTRICNLTMHFYMFHSFLSFLIGVSQVLSETIKVCECWLAPVVETSLQPSCLFNSPNYWSLFFTPVLLVHLVRTLGCYSPKAYMIPRSHSSQQALPSFPPEI